MAITDLQARREASDWRDRLLRRNDRILGCESNWLIVLREHPDFRGLVQYNEFSRRVVFGKSPSWRQCAVGERWQNQDDTQFASALQLAGIPCDRSIAACISAVAQERPIHPVRDYLKALKHDGRPRLDTWLTTYLGATGPQLYLRAVGRKFLISAVARIFQPGCQVDHMLVLQGAQGIGKTSVPRVLAVHDDWFRGELPDISRESYAQHLGGKWLIEVSELAALRRTETERMKAFLTMRHDDFRAPYARWPEQAPRQCVFIGTTNESHYLRDASGNRRFWPVACGRIDVDHLRADRDQLWAEATVLYHAKAMWHLDERETDIASVEQRERMFTSELESDVVSFLEHLRTIEGTTEVDVRGVLTRALRLDPDKPDYAERAQRLGPQVAVAMETAGWRKVGRSEQGGQRRTLYRYYQGPQGTAG
jgi:putative DNA primase/helicase